MQVAVSINFQADSKEDAQSQIDALSLPDEWLVTTMFSEMEISPPSNQEVLTPPEELFTPEQPPAE